MASKICPVCGEFKELVFGIFGAYGQDAFEPCCESCFDEYHRAFAEAKRVFCREYARDYIDMKQRERYAEIDAARERSWYDESGPADWVGEYINGNGS